jgi:hypothetical protein
MQQHSLALPAPSYNNHHLLSNKKIPTGFSSHACNEENKFSYFFYSKENIDHRIVAGVAIVIEQG